MGYWGYGYGPGMSIAGGILMILFWVLIIVFIVVLLRRAMWYDGGHDRDMRHMHRERHESTALDILKERYAKGEITKQEYEDMKKDLMGE